MRQAYAAAMFGKDDALLCPSGTMTNQIAIKVRRKLMSLLVYFRLMYLSSFSLAIPAHFLESANITQTTTRPHVQAHTQPGDELICSDTAHIYLYEGGGIASNSGLRLWRIFSFVSRGR